jgi:hypothetical protein
MDALNGALLVVYQIQTVEHNIFLLCKGDTHVSKKLLIRFSTMSFLLSFWCFVKQLLKQIHLPLLSHAGCVITTSGVLSFLLRYCFQ